MYKNFMEEVITKKTQPGSISKDSLTPKGQAE